MTTLLIPLGLLGLISIAVLIFIYIIRPNYQQKAVSSTFVWRLSLKYRKKKLPVSKLRNILLIICQILVLVACTLILARPAFVYNTDVNSNEVILVIDSSASMYTETDDYTRFETAVSSAREKAEAVLDEGGVVSVVVAGESADIVAERVTSADKLKLEASLDELIEDDAFACYYGTSDMESAMEACADIAADNPSAQVYLYTDITYSACPDGVNVVDVTQDTEWNAAILDAYVEYSGGYYVVTVKIAVYGGSNHFVDVGVHINDANSSTDSLSGMSLEFTEEKIACEAGVEHTIIFRDGGASELDGEADAIAEGTLTVSALDSTECFYSYSSILITLNDCEDSLELDNQICLYGGMKPTLKIQYASSISNRWILSALSSVKKRFADDWNIVVDEVKEDYVTEGYDLYIFEHTMPSALPTDGVVFLFDMDSVPQGTGVTLSGDTVYTSPGVYLTCGEDGEGHQLLEHVSVDDISVTKINNIKCEDPLYEILMTYDDKPVVVAKNDGASKILIVGFSVHYSNFVQSAENFAMFFLNIIKFYFPSVISSNSAEIGGSVTINSLAGAVEYKNGETTLEYEDLPATVTFTTPGTYSFAQTTDYGKDITEYVYVRTPLTESDIFPEADKLEDPFGNKVEEEQIDDWLLYLAIALVALMFIEWLLQARENF